MKNKLIKILMFCLFATVIFSSLALADEMNMTKGVEKKAEGINVALSFKDEQAKTGNNDIMVTLSDSDNQPISNAVVSATANMDKSMSMNMKNSKPIVIEFKNGDSKGQYMGNVNFTDKGKWIVKSTVNVQGQTKNIDFDVDVSSSGPNWGIIGGFFGVIALILVIAGVKKKSSKNA